MTSSLDDYLATACAGSSALAPVPATLANLAAAAAEVHAAIAAARVKDAAIPQGAGLNPSREVQKALDLFADARFLAAAQASPVAFYGSEEQEQPVVLDGGTLVLAIDPLDGSSNIETNISVGTIFSLLPVPEASRSDPEIAFRQPGSSQIAAGFFIYGPQLLLVLTVGAGTRTFLHDPEQRIFVAHASVPNVPVVGGEYAINASNRRHWPTGIRRYIEDAEAGATGPRQRDFGMRYVGSLVADAYRILQRGGVFLYPADSREGYGAGRLRQLYETNPIAFCIEQAGGAATDGCDRMLDRPSRGLHARTPFVFGSKAEVDLIANYLAPVPA